MEDAVQYIIVIAIVVIGILNAMRKSMEKGKTDPAKMTLPGKRVISTAEPETYQKPNSSPKEKEEDWESWFRNERTDERKNQPQTKQPEVKTSAYTPLKEVKNQKTFRSASSTQTAQSEQTSTIPGIRSRKEAKKAFIYSEIFNRKY